MSFRQFAYNNVRRNLRAYIAYLLSSAFMVMLFFSYAVFVFHPAIRDAEMGARTAAGMTAASAIVYVFAFFFVLYSISAFLKSRNREFGILTILGTSPGQLRRLVFTENMMVGIIAILAGLAGGFPLSYAFLGLSTANLGEESLPMYLPVRALVLTAVAFFILFLVVSACTLIFLGRNQVLDLLQGSSKPKKEPKVSILLALFGASLLLIGLLALWVHLTPMSILVAAATGIAGTYFFYSQLTVLFVRLLKRNRGRLRQGVRLLWISELAYKLRDNARMLFLITVMTALASMSTGIVLAIDQTAREEYEKQPFSLIYLTFDEKADENSAIIRDTLEEQDIPYREIVQYRLYSTVNQENGQEHYLETMPLSVYNALAQLVQVPQAELAPGTALVVRTDTREAEPWSDGERVALQHAPQTWLTSKVMLQEKLGGLGNSSNLLIVPDDDFAQIREAAEQADGYTTYPSYWYDVPEWNDGVPGRDAPELTISRLIDERLSQADNTAGYLDSRGVQYIIVKQATMLFTFIGLFIALLFSLCAASFLYFKLHTELAGDARMYHALSRIGLSEIEMRRVASRQIAILFFVPIVVAAVQTMVVVRPFLTAVNIQVFFEPVLLASGGFLALQTVYFLLARWLYVRALRKVMV
ncbi:ABC transporter permease [Paenibacillus sp. 598K]|uniref:FtsX-like permease family protein n=1 Tax=Paenibacillus sp. 598K TaxID=1117987 RepID=UPI000FF9A6A0|nr:ABC transporter permease [Paenibacillus sp. 598K]GBF77730.1 ABC transporter permease [Paenibacillus sp. 598K]